MTFLNLWKRLSGFFTAHIAPQPDSTQIQPAPPPAEPIPYCAFTTAFDQLASASEIMAWLKATTRSAGTGAEFLDSAIDIRASALARALNFQKRWASGHTLGEKPFFTILIDHSGSMRGPRAMTAALVADAIGSALEMEAIPFDVLGYTTASWHGGESRKAWFKAGRPPYPGRVCDLLHIIYRDGVTEKQNHRWRDGLQILLHDTALKENIDGEALLWAWERASAFAPTTWVCLVISDGAPVDDTTLILNGPDILHEHLQEVSRAIQNSGARIGGIGLEFDVSRYYTTAKPVKVLANAPAIAFEVLEELIWPEKETVAIVPESPPVLH